MSTIGLLTYPTDARGQAVFEFDHAQDHAILAQKVGSSTHANYFLDPALGTMKPASWFNQAHQQAHHDAADALAVQPSLNLLQGGPQDEWWLWTNHWEHLALNEALLLQG